MMIALAIALTAVAGYVDAVGYIVLSHVFTANMTGNTVASVTSLLGGDWPTLIRRGFVIPLFVLGALISRFVIDSARRKGVRVVEAYLFAGEAMLLATFWILALQHAPLLLLVGIAGGAMGMQNATISKFGALSVRTTHVTGTLSEFSQEFAEAVIGWWRREERDNGRRALELAAIWSAYALFAGIGVAAHSAWGLAALSIPIALVAAVAVTLFVTSRS
ncbi:MAG TPA: YoaK family protein [Thermoanaerobaculia bacterium]|nr:YoaK family protein [Thermoanaerobaculia bacterium]